MIDNIHFGLRRRAGKLESTQEQQGLLQDVASSDLGHDQIHRNESVQPIELPKLNQSLIAYIAVRPEKSPENYASALAEGLHSIQHMRSKVLSSCLDGSVPFGEFNIASRPVYLSAKITPNGGIDLTFHDHPGNTRLKPPYDAIDILMLNKSISEITYEIYRSGTIKNTNIINDKENKLIAMRILAQPLIDAVKLDGELIPHLKR